MNLPAQLAQLEQVEIVRRAGDPDLAYLFKHALTQETAYASLLKKTRRDVHAQVAGTIESLYADQLDENAALLARHYAEAGDDLKTLEYATRAGDASARVYANAEAVSHYSLAIGAAKRLVGTTALPGLRELYLRRGRELELASQFHGALANYSEMEDLGRERSDRALELGGLIAQSQIRCTPTSEFNPALGEPLAQQSLLLARELGDRAAESKILWILVNLYRFTDRLSEARDVGERSLAIARELNLREQMAYTLNDLAHAYSFGGDFKRAREVNQEARQLWRQLENLPMLADSLSTACMDDTMAGEFDEAVALSKEAHQISQATGNLWGQTYSLGSIGTVYWMRGEMADAIAIMEQALRLSDQSGYPVPQLLTRSDLGVALASLGSFALGLEHARRALEFANTHYASLAPYPITALVQIYLWMGDEAQARATFARSPKEGSEISFIPITRRLSGARLASALGETARALEISSELVEGLNKLAMRTFMPEAFYLRGLAERALGQTQAARLSLSEAYNHAKALEARWMLWQILGSLGELELECGNAREAEKLSGAARQHIAFIADHAPQELRETFLNIPQVQKVEYFNVEKSSQR